jgi:pyruvate,orthophosphate dikinase
LMRLAVEDGRRARPGLEIGICGEHGGDAASIELCEELDLDYVSCSPYRVPVARMAAAHATLARSPAAAGTFASGSPSPGERGSSHDKEPALRTAAV